MVQYDLNWLKGKGFFKKIVPFKVKGKEVLVDDKNLLAYTEVLNAEEVEELKRELSAQKVRYLWFFFSETGKLRVFRRIGGVKWFYYSTKMRSDYLKSRIDKLSKFSPENMNILFDIRDIVEKFYWQLWEMRVLMARGISEIKEDKNKLLVVQHLIDRLIFFYFLSQLKLVKIKNEEREWVLDKRNTREFFKWICSMLSEDDLQEFLNRIFFDVLGQVNETGWGVLEFNIKGEKFSVASPSLNGGLFVEHEIEGIRESKVKIKGIKKLILEVLNNYNWIIGEESPEEEDVVGDLTPEVIGHIYEKFVVSLEQIGLGKVRLKDIQTVKEELRYGRRKIGAYYTPEEITNYVAMNTIYPCVKDKLKDKFGDTGTRLLRDLFEKNKFSNTELNIVKHLYFEILTKIKICDNACGSGSFLIAAGEVLLRLYSRVLNVLQENLSSDKDVRNVLAEMAKSPSRNYYIVRQIIVNNLYGVDLMEGAVEIAKLRFWLWLISQVNLRKVQSKKIETLPNLDFNLMTGNSLIGFIDIEGIEFDFVAIQPKLRWKSLTDRQYLLTTWTDKDKIRWLQTLMKEKQKFKTLPAHEAVKLKEKLNKELSEARNFLNKKFFNLMKSKGVNITWKEFLELDPFHWGFEFYEAFDLNEVKENRGFDIIIGNPPHGNLLTVIEKQWIRNAHSHSKPSNCAEVFFERSFNHVKLNGRIGYIIPKTIGFYSTWGDIRNHILNHQMLENILDVGIGFIGVISEQLAIVVKKILKYQSQELTKKLIPIYIAEPLRTPSYGKEIKFAGKVPLSLMQAHNILIFRPINEIQNEIIETIRKNSIQFRMIYENAFRGLFISDDEKIKLKAGNVPFIDKEPNIQQFYIKDWKCIAIQKSWKKKADELLTPKLIFKVLRGSKIVVFADKDGKFLTPSNISNVKLKKEYEDLLLPLEVILNSPLMSFYAQKMLFSETTESARHWDDPYVGELPIPPPEKIPRKQLLHLSLFTKFVTKYYWDYYASRGKKNLEIESLIAFLQVLSHSIVYELYLKDKFSKDGIKLNLPEYVEPYFKDISNLKSDEQKLKFFMEIIEKIKNDEKIMEHIKKIKSHPWVKVVEECL
jgi:hypothetical protein